MVARFGVMRLSTVIWICCVLVALAVQLPLALNHDAAWHFQTSLRVLGGDRFGRDVSDINPPMTAWLFLPAAWIVQTSDASANLVVKLFTVVVCSLSYFVTLALLARGPRRIGGWIVPAVIGGGLFVMPGYDFAQREHLAAALTLPYVVLAGQRADDAKIRWPAAALVGMLGGLGIGIKPYFVALPICIEAWLALQRRQPGKILRGEVMAIVAIGTVYLAAVTLFAPDYLTRVIPDALSNYGGLKAPWDVFAREMLVYLAFPLLACALVLVLAWRGGLPQTLRAALFAALGFALAAIMQQKGWPYQFYPVAFFLLASAAFGLERIGVADAVRTLRGAAALSLVVLAVTYRATLFVQYGYSPNGPTANVRALTGVIEREAGPDQSVFAFITSPRDIHPAVLASGRRWAGKAGVFMYLPAAVNANMAGTERPNDAERMASVARRHDRSLLKRLAQSPPGIIVIDDRPAKLGIRDPSFAYLAYFHRYPCFQEIMTGYAEVKPVAGFRIFDRREPLQAHWTTRLAQACF